MSDKEFLKVYNLKKYYPVKKEGFSLEKKYVKAVDSVSFSLEKGKTLGLVGESGCGKSTIGRTILCLETATEGEVWFKGSNILKFNKSEMRSLRQKMQIIFQDPFSSLNPKMTVGQMVGEALHIHHIAEGKKKDNRVKELLEMVGLRDFHAKRYPHEFSGGQRQRIGIARALAVNPELIVCDEPVSALDVSIQAQILNLLSNLKKEMGLTYIFIAHGLAAVRHISDDVGVMYLGKLVEMANGDEIYNNPLHPYTIALMSAALDPDPDSEKKRIVLEGDVPSPVNPPLGCRFHTRCRECKDICKEKEPEFKEKNNNHFVACHLR